MQGPRAVAHACLHTLDGRSELACANQEAEDAKPRSPRGDDREAPATGGSIAQLDMLRTHWVRQSKNLIAGLSEDDFMKYYGHERRFDATPSQTQAAVPIAVLEEKKPVAAEPVAEEASAEDAEPSQPQAATEERQLTANRWREGLLLDGDKAGPPYGVDKCMHCNEMWPCSFRNECGHCGHHPTMGHDGVEHCPKCLHPLLNALEICRPCTDRLRIESGVDHCPKCLQPVLNVLGVCWPCTERLQIEGGLPVGCGLEGLEALRPVLFPTDGAAAPAVPTEGAAAPAVKVEVKEEPPQTSVDRRWFAYGDADGDACVWGRLGMGTPVYGNADGAQSHLSLVDLERSQTTPPRKATISSIA